MLVYVMLSKRYVLSIVTTHDVDIGIDFIFSSLRRSSTTSGSNIFDIFNILDHQRRQGTTPVRGSTRTDRSSGNSNRSSHPSREPIVHLYQINSQSTLSITNPSHMFSYAITGASNPANTFQAIVRDPQSPAISEIVSKDPNVHVIKGDVTDPASISATRGTG